MRDQARVVVIGGGIVGVSVAYHLALRGVTDIVLVERDRLTAGSSWHAAGGFHAINADTKIAALQRYTIGMYPVIEAESGQALGLKQSGGIELAATAERWHWLKAELAWLRTQGHDGAELLTPAEAATLVPIIDPAGLYGALFDPDEGNLDPNGATYAYATAARARGVEIVQGNRVTALARRPGGDWDVTTEQGTIVAEHVVNAAGLWARRVGRMVGLDHPLVPMPHHYLVTDAIPAVAAIPGLMPAVTDLEGFTYLQREGDGVLLGIYEQRPIHWAVEGAPWDFGMTLFPRGGRPDPSGAAAGLQALPRPSGRRHQAMGQRRLHVHARRQPARRTGRGTSWLLGGLRLHGRVLARRRDRPGPGQLDRGRRPRATTCSAWTWPGSVGMPRTTRTCGRRPPSSMPAGSSCRTRTRSSRLGDRSRRRRATTRSLAAGARFTVNWGLEVPLYFAPSPDFHENETLGRSNAEPIVAEEVAAVRTAAGAYEIAQYARYEVTGPGAGAWLDHLLAGRLPDDRADPTDTDAQRRRSTDGRPHGHAPRRRPVLADRLVLPPGVARALVRPPSARVRGHDPEPDR